MAVKRTFGWVQNAADLRKLKLLTGIFCPDSDINRWLREERLALLLNNDFISKSDYDIFINNLSEQDIEIKYSLLKGKGVKPGQTRSMAKCTGIVQAVIDAQMKVPVKDCSGNYRMIHKPFTDDWSAESYIRWAVSCGLLTYNAETDTCKVSDLGELLAKSEDGSAEERECFTQALFLYPPVVRILSLLSEKDGQGQPVKLTKFELGSRLGFRGELGFSSIPQNVYACDFCEASDSEKSKVRSNEEGDSDKYARGIASWLKQMDWITVGKKRVIEEYANHIYEVELMSYSIKRKGEQVLKNARGNSSHKRIEKIVMFEMLASNKANGAGYLRTERAHILQALSKGKNSVDIGQIQARLMDKGLELSEDAIRDHIKGLIAIGLDIEEVASDKFKLRDIIKCLRIPEDASHDKTSINDLKEEVRSKLKYLDHKYLILIDLAYSASKDKTKKNTDARDFEIWTALLFEELGFKSVRLGDSSRPDVIISHDKWGTIIDNKSYKEGFSIPKNSADEMGRYIIEVRQKNPNQPPNEWWKNFSPIVQNYTFLFVTSELTGKFKNQLQSMKNLYGIEGAAIGVKHLLYMAELLKSNKITYADFYNNFNSDEMIYNLL